MNLRDALREVRRFLDLKPYAPDRGLHKEMLLLEHDPPNAARDIDLAARAIKHLEQRHRPPWALICWLRDALAATQSTEGVTK